MFSAFGARRPVQSGSYLRRNQWVRMSSVLSVSVSVRAEPSAGLPPTDARGRPPYIRASV